MELDTRENIGQDPSRLTASLGSELIRLKKNALEARLSDYPPEIRSVVWILLERKVERLSQVSSTRDPVPCWFIAESSTQKQSKTGYRYHWIKFRDDVWQKRLYAYSTTAIPPGSLCVCLGKKKGYFFSVSRIKVISGVPSDAVKRLGS